MAGFFPFSAIYIELYYVLSSIWGHRTYTLYGILLLAFVLLLLVAICINIAIAYFRLSTENWKW